MCMDEFVKKLYDFRDIYKIFWSQCDLILTFGFDFIQNSRYIFDISDILLIFTDIYIYIYIIFTDIFFKNSNTCAHEI